MDLELYIQLSAGKAGDVLTRLDRKTSTATLERLESPGDGRVGKFANSMCQP